MRPERNARASTECSFTAELLNLDGIGSEGLIEVTIMTQTIYEREFQANETHEQEPETILQLVYASAATVEFDQEDLVELLRRARENNESLGVTGMLLFHDGSFIQVLEGPPDVVDALFSKIASDPRHGDTTLIYRGQKTERCFGRWSMGFEHVLDRREMPRGLNRFLQNGILRVEPEEGEAVCRSLIGFRDGRFRRA